MITTILQLWCLAKRGEAGEIWPHNCKIDTIGTAGELRAGNRGHAHALPRIRLTVVPQTGHLPLAIFMPVFVSAISPSKSRFSLHLTQ